MNQDMGRDQQWLQLAVLLLLIAQFLPRTGVDAGPLRSPAPEMTAAATVMPITCTVNGRRGNDRHGTLERHQPVVRVVAGQPPEAQPIAPPRGSEPEPPAPESVPAAPLEEPRLPAVATIAAESAAEPWVAPEVQIAPVAARPVLVRAMSVKQPATQRKSAVAYARPHRVLTGNADEVYQALRGDLEANVTDPGYLALLAVAALRAERFAEAEVIYRHLVVADHSEPRWWMGLATAQRALGHDHRAAQRQVLALAAADTVLHRRAEANLLLAQGTHSPDGGELPWQPGESMS
ncbi:MAG: hypothetical protein AAGG11_21020 [Pseudomonadota bacterium]